MFSPRSEVPPSSFREEVFQDAARIWGEQRPALKDLVGAFINDPGLAAAFLFRHSKRLAREGHPFVASVVSRINLALHGCQFSPEAQIGPGLRLPHPMGVVVGRGVRAGRDLTLYQNVTLGAKSLGGDDYPVLGNGIVVFPQSLVFGSIELGDNARVGAGSVVFRDVAAGDTVAGAPAASLRRPAENPVSREEQAGK